MYNVVFKMKFTTTKNITWRPGIGKFPKAWIEYSNFRPDEDYEDIYQSSIIKYFYNHIKVWDFDVCGDGTHDFVFEDGKAFRLEYSWWRDDYVEEDESCLKDEYYIEEITLNEANVLEKTMRRDWL
jgi:hypothetical protein